MRWTVAGPPPSPLSWPELQLTSCPSARRLCRSIMSWWSRELGSMPVKSAAKPSSPWLTARNTSVSTQERSPTRVSSVGSASASPPTFTSIPRPPACAGRTVTCPTPCCSAEVAASSRVGRTSRIGQQDEYIRNRWWMEFQIPTMFRFFLLKLWQMCCPD